MKKLVVAMSLLALLAVSCQKNKSGDNPPLGMPVVDQVSSAMLANLQMAFQNVKSFKFDGQVTQTFNQSYQQNFTNTFSGTAVWPQTEDTINNYHNVLTRDGQALEDSTNTKHSIVVGNKIFQQSYYYGKLMPWAGELINDPLSPEKKTQTAYKFPGWLVLSVAQDLTFQKQDGDLGIYTVVPKTIDYADALSIAGHQGRLTIWNNPALPVNAIISGTVWVNKNFLVTKEQFEIKEGPYVVKQGGNQQPVSNNSADVSIVINYSAYNGTFTITQPVATPQLDYIMQQSAAGKTREQIMQGLQQQSKDFANTPEGRDEARVGQINQLRSVLEIYSMEHNGAFPSTLSAAMPKGISVPAAPEPADGSCTEQQNAFSYKLVTPQSYQISFCLGTVYRLGAGVHTATEKGIQ